MQRMALTVVVSLALLSHSPADAQSSRGAGVPEHAVEIGAHGGYVWTFARDVYYPPLNGQLDIRSSGSWGITADFIAGPGTQLELLYNRQDSKLTYDEPVASQLDVIDVNVEYWHVGALYGVPRGNLLPFGLLTLGATRIDYEGSNYSDTWKFSIIFGLGVKAYVNERFGVRAQARLPFTFVSGGFGLGCSSGGGCYTTVGGTGIVQTDLSAGAFAMF